MSIHRKRSASSNGMLRNCTLEPRLAAPAALQSVQAMRHNARAVRRLPSLLAEGRCCPSQRPATRGPQIALRRGERGTLSRKTRPTCGRLRSSERSSLVGVPAEVCSRRPHRGCRAHRSMALLEPVSSASQCRMMIAESHLRFLLETASCHISTLSWHVRFCRCRSNPVSCKSPTHNELTHAAQHNTCAKSAHDPS